MRRLGSIVALVCVLVACGRPAAPGSGEDPQARRLGIYEAAVRGMAATEPWYGAIYIVDRICAAADVWQGDCSDAFTQIEQRRLSSALSDLPDVRFIHEPDTVVLADSRVRNDGAVIGLGPIQEDGDRVEVPGSAYCGNVCGHGMTMVIERSSSGWTMTGTTGGVAVA